MNDYLTFEAFISNADIKTIAENVKAWNKKIIAEGDGYSKDRKYDPILVVTINNIYTALSSINLMNEMGNVPLDKLKRSIEKLIVVHQQLIDYRKDNEIVEGLLINVMNELTVFYPLFMISEIMELED